MLKISEFQSKDIITIHDGKRLGTALDLEIDTATGKVVSLIVTGTGKLTGLFNKEEQTIIPWNQIIKIGADVILVNPGTAINPFKIEPGKGF
ncbi:YlmC/YmxH family sporulation protein [Peribacillus deserti]|uniref:YlmC/YmxH family sporulation protein n=1 Tax=Peribacillus deserti TaxID=673318 RepID=A0ABS2QHB5_9BACI|nr:YlmC/YmxH family sporulation protein [Peribacillus deserti]MBM7692350.1 YlmC/YmxH family sporulation protein [Peribacillus deserti]